MLVIQITRIYICKKFIEIQVVLMGSYCPEFLLAFGDRSGIYSMCNRNMWLGDHQYQTSLAVLCYKLGSATRIV